MFPAFRNQASMDNRRRKQRMRGQCRVTLFYLHFTISTLADIVALAALWSASITPMITVGTGQHNYRKPYRFISYDCGPLWRWTFALGSRVDNRRIAVLV
jgi:hypothetical protein